MTLLTNHEFCTALVFSLGHFLWQGMAAAAVTWLIARECRSARTRYRVFVAGLLVMTGCLPITLLVTQAMSPGAPPRDSISTLSPAPRSANPPAVVPSSITSLEGPAQNDLTPVADPMPPSVRPELTAATHTQSVGAAAEATWKRLTPYIIQFYSAGVLLMLLRLITGLWGGWKLRRSAILVDDVLLIAVLSRQVNSLKVRFVPVLAYCDLVTVPTVIGILKPTILLPLAMTSGLAPEQIGSVLAHELAHLARYDHLVNLLQRVIESVLFFHPAAWWISHNVRVEREHCCDDLVVACGTAPIDYATLLLRVAELSHQCQPGKSFATVCLLATDGKPSTLRVRIARLLGDPLDSHLRLSKRWPVLILCVTCVTMASFTFQLALHSEPENPKPKSTVSVDSEAPAPHVVQAEGSQIAPSDRDLLQRLVRGGKIDSRSLQRMITQVAQTAVKNESFAKEVLNELEKSCLADPPNRQLHDLLAVMAEIFESRSEPRWKSQLAQLAPNDVKRATPDPSEAAKTVDAEYLKKLIHHAYNADRSNIADFTLAARLLHHPASLDYLRDVLRNQDTNQAAPQANHAAVLSKWKDNVGGGWGDAKFVAAVGLAELNDAEGVEWLLAQARDNQFGIDGSLWQHQHSRDRRGSLRASSRLALADLFGMRGEPSFEQLSERWRDLKPKFIASPVALILGLSRPQRVVELN